MSSAEGMQIPEDLLQALNHCDSAVANETGWRVAALRSIIAEECHHDEGHKPYSALVMAYERIARLEAQNAKLEAEVKRLNGILEGVCDSYERQLSSTRAAKERQ